MKLRRPNLLCHPNLLHHPNQLRHPNLLHHPNQLDHHNLYRLVLKRRVDRQWVQARRVWEYYCGIVLIFCECPDVDGCVFCECCYFGRWMLLFWTDNRLTIMWCIIFVILMTIMSPINVDDKHCIGQVLCWWQLCDIWYLFLWWQLGHVFMLTTTQYGLLSICFRYYFVYVIHVVPY